MQASIFVCICVQDGVLIINQTHALRLPQALYTFLSMLLFVSI